MSETAQSNVAFVRNYLAALERGIVGEALSAFFTGDIVQVEFPNRLNPKGQQSDLASILDRSVRGQQLLSAQRYDLLTELAQGNRVAVEARWIGTLAIAVGALPAGTQLRANFAMFFEFREGRIARQHNYDCFDP